MRNPNRSTVIAILVAFTIILVLAACAPTPKANGDVLNFSKGDVKTVTNGEVSVTFTYEGDGNWTCSYGQGDNLCVQDVAGEIMFFYGTDKIGTETINEQGEMNLFDEWREQTKGG